MGSMQYDRKMFRGLPHKLDAEQRKEAARLFALPTCCGCLQPIDGEDELARKLGVLADGPLCLACEGDILRGTLGRLRQDNGWPALSSRLADERIVYASMLFDGDNRAPYWLPGWLERLDRAFDAGTWELRKTQAERSRLLRLAKELDLWDARQVELKREELAALQAQRDRTIADRARADQRLAELETQLAGKGPA